MTDDEYREQARASLERFSRTGIDESYWTAFADSLHYVSGGVDDHEGLRPPRGWQGGEGHGVYSLSTRASFFPVIVDNMGKTGLNDQPGFTRVVIEKPFGHDLESA